MNQGMILPRRAFCVHFHEFNRWDPISYYQIDWYWPKEIMVPIGRLLVPRKDKVNRAKNGFADLMPITIHFDGTIEPRKVEPSKEYSMDLFWAHPTDIVVSKIDLKNGAVAIIPESWRNVVVTGHFAIYEPKKDLIVSEYFHIIIQTEFFKNYLWRNKVGAEGRKEVKLDFFESIAIPVPHLQDQKAIVEFWYKAQATSDVIEERISEIQQKIVARFSSELGLTLQTPIENSTFFAVHWKELERWSASYNQAIRSTVDLLRGKYPVVNLGSLLEMVQYGTSEKANNNKLGIPVIRMNNIIEGELDLSNLKYIHLPKKTLDNLFLKEGDILFNRTNSKELVGKCAVFHENGNYVFASYLIRICADKAKANPDFLSFVINSPIGRRQINALSRQIIGQANINSQELRSLQIPLPPLEIQHKIMDWVKEGTAEIINERNSSEWLRQKTKKEIEEMILGVRPAGGVQPGSS